MKSPVRILRKPQLTSPASEETPASSLSELSPQKKLRVVASLDFQFVSAPQCSASLLQEISEFLDSQDTSHPFQWWPWAVGNSYLAALRREGRIQWFAQCAAFYPAGRFLRSIRALHVNRGPVCDDPELVEIGFSQLISKARQMRMTYVEIAPEWADPLADFAADLLTHSRWQLLPGARSSLRLDLGPAADQLLAGFRKTTRYEIRRSEAAAVKVTMANSETEIQDFLDLYQKMATQKEFVSDDRDFLLGVLRWLAVDPHRGGLFLAWEEERLRGGAVIVRSALRSWYLWGATSKESKLNVGHLLQWRAIQWAKSEGCLEHDFGGFRPGMTTGPAHFKSGFCDRVVNFLPPHRYVLSPVRMNALNLVSKTRKSLAALKRDPST